MIRCFHGDGVGDEIGSKHQTNGDECSSLLGLASCKEREQEKGKRFLCLVVMSL